MQDHRKAIIVGTHTFGKAVFEQTFTLDNGCRAKFIIGAMYRPKGSSWQSVGVTPDFKVEQSAASEKALAKLPPAERLQKDLCLLTAVKLLQMEQP